MNTCDCHYCVEKNISEYGELIFLIAEMEQ